MDTDFLKTWVGGGEGKMEKQKENITIYNYPSYYPHISDKVIKCLQNDFPNQ